MSSPELAVCIPSPIRDDCFNSHADIPFGCTIEHFRKAMQELQDFLSLVNHQIVAREIPRLESLMMPANFSSLVGEFVHAAIPKYCKSLVKNTYHNGHPDLIPVGAYPHDAVQHGHVGIETKASRFTKGWQGHNAEASWLMVFVLDSNRPSDVVKGILPRPFTFVKVVGAQLEITDWSFAGRSETSRRTITASITAAGYAKMEANWLYRLPNISHNVEPVDEDRDQTTQI